MFAKLCLVMFLVSICGLSSTATTLVKDGKPIAEIVIDAENPDEVLKTAGNELQMWVEKISGGKLPIVPAPGTATTKIFLGTPDASKTIQGIAKQYAAALEKMEDKDGFIIKTEDHAIYIFSNLNKGVLNGVYRFLELNSDIIFVRPMEEDDGFGTIFGKTPDFTAKDLELVDSPKFKLRYLGPGSYKWQARLLNYPIDSSRKPERQYGVIRATHNAIIRATALGKEKPEYFAMRDGKREQGWYTQLCFSNKELLEYYTTRMDRVFEENPDCKMFGVNHSDNWRVCECPECMKPITLEDGTLVQPDDPAFRSTAFWGFYDRVMKAIGNKHPNQYLTSLAYVWSAEPPKMKISDQISVTFAPFVKSHKVPIYHDENKLWGDRIEKWTKQHDRLLIYEYYLCTTTPLFYNPVADIAALDLRYYLKNGVLGMKNDCTMTDDDAGKVNNNAPAFPPSNGFDVSAMEYWLVSRLYWNPDQDVEKLRDEYCRRAYREAAQPMREYYSIIRDVWHKDKVACYWNDEPVISARRYIVSNNLQEPCRELLEKAEKMAVHPGSKTLIQRHRAVFEKWLAMEKALGEKVELPVPLCEKVDVNNFDYTSGCWEKAAVIDDFRVRNNFNDKATIPTTVKVLHDRQNLYLAYDCRNEKAELMATLKGLQPKARGVWPDRPCCEIFLDGDKRDVGGYYHIAFNAIGGMYDALGYDAQYDNEKWSVTSEISNESWKAIVVIPLESFGININTGNRIGLTLFRNTGNSTWRGANVHQPGGFNDLILQNE